MVDLADHRARAERHLVEAVGGSLCAIGKSGRSFPAAKYHEGAVAALAEAMRTDATVHDLEALVARWRRPAGVTADSPDWIAYREGGVDALEAVLAELHPTA